MPDWCIAMVVSTNNLAAFSGDIIHHNKKGEPPKPPP
jgi:hypothetical protein